MLAAMVEDGGDVNCGICSKLVPIYFTIEPEEDKEYELLENLLGDISNWGLCLRCLIGFKVELGNRLKIVSLEDIINRPDEYLEKDLEIIAKALSKTQPKCMCGNELEIEDFEYLYRHKDKCMFLPLKKIKIKCNNCGFNVDKESNKGEPIGYVLFGDITSCDKTSFVIRLIGNSKDETLEGIYIIKHNYDLEPLKKLVEMGEVVEVITVCDDPKTLRAISINA